MIPVFAAMTAIFPVSRCARDMSRPGNRSEMSRCQVACPQPAMRPISSARENFCSANHAIARLRQPRILLGPDAFVNEAYKGLVSGRDRICIGSIGTAYAFNEIVDKKRNAFQNLAKTMRGEHRNYKDSGGRENVFRSYFHAGMSSDEQQ